jgi:hypothetical protein
MTPEDFWKKWHNTRTMHMPECCEEHCSCGCEDMFKQRDKDRRSIIPETAPDSGDPYR